MERTLLGDPGHHDRILVDELVQGVIPLQRGDIVVFSDPGHWLPAAPAAPVDPVSSAVDGLGSLVGLSTTDSTQYLVKRVIGLPGDHVACCDALGRLSVNGLPVVEPYMQTIPGTDAVSGTPFDVVVPAHDLWVMGDNRYRSADSRVHGLVPVRDVVGRTFVISWPVSRWRYLGVPTAFAGVPSPIR